MLPKNTIAQSKGNSTKEYVLERLEFLKSTSINSKEKHTLRGIIHAIKCGKYDYRIVKPESVKPEKEYDPDIECEKDAYRNKCVNRKRIARKGWTVEYWHKRQVLDSHNLIRYDIRENLFQF